jgi:hypothetical protein
MAPPARRSGPPAAYLPPAQCSTLAPAMWVLILFGLSCLVTGLLFRALARYMGAPKAENVARAAMLAKAKPFAEAAPGEHVVVSGVAAAGPQGAIAAPLSGTPSAWVRVEATEERSTDPEASFATLFVVRAGAGFHVTLAGGSSVPVALGEADVGGLVETKSGPVVRPSAALAAFLDANGAPAAASDDFVRRREYLEKALGVGRPVLVLGIKQTGDGGAAKASAYRGSSQGPWVEAALADASLDENDIRQAARYERPGVGVVLGWLFAVGGPVLAVLGAVGGHARDFPNVMENGLGALAVPPIVALVLWFGLSTVKEWLFD